MTEHMRVRDLLEALADKDPLAFVYASGSGEPDGEQDVGFLVCSVRTTDPNFVELELA